MKKRIAIVGAGASGLACAYELKRAGAEVVVFEKNETPGGRMSTVYDKHGLAFDLGANFYRGDNTYIKKYSAELKIPYTPVPALTRQVLYKGERVRSEIFPLKESILTKPGMIKNKWPLVKLIAQAIFRGRGMYDLLATPASLSKDPIETLAKQISEDFDHYTCAAPIEGLTFYGTDIMTHSFLVNGVRQALLSLFTKRHNSGTMETLPKAFARVLPIQHETVTRVEHKDGSVVVETDKQTESFDAVVIATPNTSDFFKGSPEHQKLINGTEYSQTVAGGFVVPAEAINDFAMVYVPHKESSIVSIILNEGRKQTVDGLAVLGFATHHKATKEILSQKSDAEVEDIIRKEIIRIFPEYSEILQDAPVGALKRWTHAIAMYTPEQVERTREFLQHGQGVDGIYITGDLLATPFVEGSMTSGNKTAQAVIKDLGLNA